MDECMLTREIESHSNTCSQEYLAIVMVALEGLIHPVKTFPIVYVVASQVAEF